MLANAVYQQQIIWLTHRHRRQASSHTDLCLTQNFHPPKPKTVGAGLLANAVYQQQIIWLTHRHCRQASSHTDLCLTQNFPPATVQKCGSGLARECGVSAANNLADPPPSQASQLPH
ncbi:hypothetical protein C4J83_5083 [Pseudomonas sp. LBUM920]|nr:hypothetical protein C4J83_5083 [Pseudomonas sp. LBUM920]